MNTQWLVTALGLLAGTYLVRVIPFWIPDIGSTSPRIRRFLEMVPPAALGALILPDAFSAIPPMLAAGVLVTSVGLTLRGVPLTAVVAVAIGIAYLAL